MTTDPTPDEGAAAQDCHPVYCVGGPCAATCLRMDDPNPIEMPDDRRAFTADRIRESLEGLADADRPAIPLRRAIDLYWGQDAPTARELVLYAEACGVTVDWLLTGIRGAGQGAGAELTTPVTVSVHGDRDLTPAWAASAIPVEEPANPRCSPITGVRMDSGDVVTPAPPCTWPDCLTPEQSAELVADIEVELHGEAAPARADQREACGCREGIGAPTCPCCDFGNHAEPCTCDGSACCHPAEHVPGPARLPDVHPTSEPYAYQQPPAFTWAESVASHGIGPTAVIDIDVHAPGHDVPVPVEIPLDQARVLHAMLSGVLEEHGGPTLAGQEPVGDGSLVAKKRAAARRMSCGHDITSRCDDCDETERAWRAELSAAYRDLGGSRGAIRTLMRSLRAQDARAKQAEAERDAAGQAVARAELAAERADADVNHNADLAHDWRTERDQARATNQRLNLRCQRAESRFAKVTRAVADWEIGERRTYVSLSSLNAIAKAVGIEIDTTGWELHGQRMKALEAERDAALGMADADSRQLAEVDERCDTAQARIAAALAVAEVIDANGIGWAAASIRRALTGQEPTP